MLLNAIQTTGKIIKCTIQTAGHTEMIKTYLASRHSAEHVRGICFVITEQLRRRYGRGVCRSTKRRQVTEVGILVGVDASAVRILVRRTGEA